MATTMQSKRRSLANTSDSLIKLECVRRKNRRASITDQFVLPRGTTKKEERMLQSRHHAFLLQHDAAADIHGIVARVRALADADAATVGHSLSPMDKHRLHTWADDVLAILAVPFEPSDQFTNDPIWRILEKLQFLQDGHVCLAEVAIDGRQLVEKWERVGIFDEDTSDSAIDDDTKGSDEKSGSAGELEDPSGGAASPLQPPPVDWETEKLRRITQSYAYQRIRERAAARVIKRNTLKWVRSRAAFCSRVEELEVFGNTTASLMTELTASTVRRAVGTASSGADFFDLMKGRRGGDNQRGINFKELMQFSRHIALFTVDHALRRVEELALKRRLYEARCILKLQTWWRKMHEVVKGRRMLKLLAEVKRKQDEEKAQREAELRAAKEKRGKAGKSETAGDSSSSGSSRKVAKPPPIKTTRSPSISVARPAGSKNGGADSDRSLLSDSASPRGGSRTTRGRDSKAFLPTPPSTPKVSSGAGKAPVNSNGKKLVHGAPGSSSSSTADIKAEEKAARIARAAQAKEARLRREFEEELQRQRREDEEAAKDTDDVESAWKRFLESAAEAEVDVVGGEDPADEDDGQERAPTANSLENEHDHAVELAAEWQGWSDDENESSQLDRMSVHSRITTPHSTVSSRLSTPHSVESAASSRRGTPSSLADQPAPTRPMRPMKVVVTVKRSATERPSKTDPAAATPAVGSTRDMLPAAPRTASPEEESTAGLQSQSRRRLVAGSFRNSETRQVVRGAGRLSVMMPFGDPAPVPTEPPRPSPRHQQSTRRHLHEMEFYQPAAVVEATELFRFDTTLSEVTGGSEPAATELHTVEALVTRPVSPLRMFASLRASRVARMRAALHRKRRQHGVGTPVDGTDDDRLSEDEDEEEDEKGGREATAPTTYKSELPAKPEHELVLNTAESVPRRIRGRASVVAAYINNPMLKLDFRKEDLTRSAAQTTSDATNKEAPRLSTPQAAETVAKPKFGSHAEWLASMGLGDAMALATRGPRASVSMAHRAVQSRAQQGAVQVASSVAMVQMNEAQRVQRKRKEEHALPLLGKRKGDASTTKGKLHVVPTPSLPAVSGRIEDGSETPATVHRSPRHSDRNQHQPSIEREAGATHTSQRGDVEEGELFSDDDHASDGNSNSTQYESTSDSEASERELQHDPEDSSSAGVSGESEASDEKGDEDEEECLEPASEKPATKMRRRSHRRSTRRRASLHEPKHKRSDTRASRPKKKRKQRPRVDKQTESDDARETVDEDCPSPGRVRGHRFRQRKPSLLQRLVPKENRWSLGVLGAAHQCDAGSGTDEAGSNSDGEGFESGADDSPSRPTEAERAAAFKHLFDQYMGLLHTVPTLS